MVQLVQSSEQDNMLIYLSDQLVQSTGKCSPMGRLIYPSCLSGHSWCDVTNVQVFKLFEMVKVPHRGGGGVCSGSQGKRGAAGPLGPQGRPGAYVCLLTFSLFGLEFPVENLYTKAYVK